MAWFEEGSPVKRAWLLLFFVALNLCPLVGCGAQVSPSPVPASTDASVATATSALALTATSPIPATAVPATSLPEPTAPPVSQPVVNAFGTEMRQVDDAHGLSLAVDAGVHWLRFRAFAWDEIEPMRTEPPAYHWEVVDEDSLRNAAEIGMEVIAGIQYAPEWAQKVPGSYCGPIREDRLPEFAQFLQALVARYSGPPYHVRYWELGNEPDVDPALVNAHSVFGCWGDREDETYGGRYYAEMLKVAYPAIKSVDPQAQVLIGGLLLDRPSGGEDNHPRFLEGILEGGGGPFFDLVSFHAYAYYGGTLGLMGNPLWPDSATVMPAKVAFLREVLAQYGYGDKPLLNTEGALLCAEASEDCFEMQAAYVPRVYAEALALGLEAQVYYAWINEGWRYTGLLQPDLTPKPVYNAYKAAATFLSQASYEREVMGYPQGMVGYTFSRPDRAVRVDVIWSEDGTARRVTLPAAASAYDRYGEPLAAGDAIEVDFSPVFVVSPWQGE
jgi:hypothetical protein